MVVKTIGVQDALVHVAKDIAILEASLFTSEEMDVSTCVGTNYKPFHPVGPVFIVTLNDNASVQTKISGGQVVFRMRDERSTTVWPSPGCTSAVRPIPWGILGLMLGWTKSIKGRSNGSHWQTGSTTRAKMESGKFFDGRAGGTRVQMKSFQLLFGFHHPAETLAKMKSTSRRIT